MEEDVLERTDGRVEGPLDRRLVVARGTLDAVGRRGVGAEDRVEAAMLGELRLEGGCNGVVRQVSLDGSDPVGVGGGC